MYKNDQSNHIKDNLCNFNQINNIISNRHRQLSELTSFEGIDDGSLPEGRFMGFYATWGCWRYYHRKFYLIIGEVGGNPDTGQIRTEGFLGNYRAKKDFNAAI